MTYKLIHKDRVLVQSDWLVTIPMSHNMGTKAEATQFMLARGMQSYCEVVPSDYNFEPAR